MLGIGLGGFAQGFERGLGIAEKIDKRQRQRAVDTAVDQGQAEHQAAVAAGTAKADDADSILRFTMPKVMGPLLKSGDLRAAEQASEWLRSDTTRRATDSWGKGMIAAQAGDMQGALTHFANAARTKNYGPDLTIEDPKPIDGGGFRVTFATKDGRRLNKDFKSPDEVIKFGATSINPQVALQTWQEQQAAEQKAARDTKTSGDIYRQRQEIDLEYDKTRRAVGLDPTTTATTGYRDRKKVDIDHEQEQRRLGLGPSNFDPQNVVQTGPDGKPVVKPYVFDRRKGTARPMRDDDGNEISGEVARPGTHSTDGTTKTGVTERVIAELRKENPNLTYQDALSLTKRAPSGDRDLLRREALALSAAKADTAYLTNPSQVIEKYRKQYGLNSPAAPSATPAPPVARPAAQRPDMMTKGDGHKPLDIAIPPRPASVPAGSAYSPSRRQWRTPDGKVLDASGNPVE
jgi:hypothetical protein